MVKISILSSWLVSLIFVASAWADNSVANLNSDVKIIMPVVKVASGVIDLATAGQPLKMDISKGEIAQSVALLAKRTGLNPPIGIFNKVQTFFNQVSERVAQTGVKELQRKSIAEIGQDMKDILDGIVMHVGTSSAGIYSDMSAARVNDKPLQDAMVDVGLQFKALKTDLMFYREVAHKILGVPVMPIVASQLVSMIRATNATTPQFISDPLIYASATANQALSTISKSAGDVGKNIASLPASFLRNLKRSQTLTAN